MKMTGKYDFLSNFHPCKVEAWGITFPSLEHAYVACKTTDMALKRRVASISYAGQAKKFGRQLTLRSDWSERKLDFMLALLRRKFSDASLAYSLLQVEEPIVEDNTWGDTFWGVCNGVGSNHLGKLLEQVREELLYHISDVAS